MIILYTNPISIFIFFYIYPTKIYLVGDIFTIKFGYTNPAPLNQRNGFIIAIVNYCSLMNM